MLSAVELPTVPGLQSATAERVLKLYAGVIASRVAFHY
jgi:hypothetical protein